MIVQDLYTISESLTKICGAPPSGQPAEVERVQVALKSVTSTKNAYRSKWVKMVVAEKVQAVEETAGKTQVVSLFFESPDSGDEARGVLQDGIFGFKDAFGYYEPAKNKATDEVDDGNAKKLVGNTKKMVGIVVVAPHTITEMRGAKKMSTEGLWGMVGPSDVVTTKFAGTLAEGLLSKGGGGRDGVCQGKWTWPVDKAHGIRKMDVLFERGVNSVERKLAEEV